MRLLFGPARKSLSLQLAQPLGYSMRFAKAPFGLLCAAAPVSHEFLAKLDLAQVGRTAVT